MDAELEVRPPKQQRSREAWNRVLDAGVAVLEEGGSDSFTIAAVCDRARVAPTAIYARTTSKDALFLAVYEHGVGRLRDEQAVFADDTRWAGLPPAELVRAAVAEMVGISFRHAPFLRAVVLVSAVHPEVRRRGSRYSQELGEGFVQVVLAARDVIGHPDPEAAVRSCFGTVFAASIIRVAYGPGFATPTPVDDERFVADLGETAARYLLADVVD
ncbi:TetR/AcrR family transcriptional regulator [Blastococcus atacamensis]|uniref:TetR/AcrR family transcriptional regulator n=1 Tax=Blastococcus atacamensis TaxID=2070508 RepID=UPI000CEBA3A5|nr:TetR/AcrR family transcriptional regulator [Blastococcus atacamensis]